jgi:hypothetical protein
MRAKPPMILGGRVGIDKTEGGGVRCSIPVEILTNANDTIIWYTFRDNNCTE